jgi:hypothetical protein
MGNVTARAEALLKAKGVRFSKSMKGDWTSIKLEPVGGSDFSFFIEDYSDGNANLGANRTGGEPNEHFFYLAYEPPDFKSPEELESKALNDLELLISNPVRIRCFRGLLFLNAVAEVMQAGEIKTIPGVSSLGWGFKFPLGANERTFQTPALTTGARDV